MSVGIRPEDGARESTETRATFRRTLRRDLVERRQALAADDCRRLSQAVCAHLAGAFPQLAGQRVGFCWPVHNEPDLRPLILSWLAAGQPGFAALLPVVISPGEALAFRAWTPDSPLSNDRHGIPTPTAGEFLVPQALLIPVNAFDAAGYRIGYGGGYFDRTLAALVPAPLSIGVGFELARVASVRPEAHDVRLDAMVTEAGVFRSGQANSERA